MSKNINRAKLNLAQNNSIYRKIWINFEYPIYWEEGMMEYPQYRRGFKNPIKRIFSYQVRMYKTWKYNRKTQYKDL